MEKEKKTYLLSSLIVGALTAALSAFGFLIWDAAVVGNRFRLDQLESIVSKQNELSLEQEIRVGVNLSRVISLEASIRDLRRRFTEIENDFDRSVKNSEIIALRNEVDRYRIDVSKVVDVELIKEQFAESGVGHIWLGSINSKGEFSRKSFIFADGTNFDGIWTKLPIGKFYIYNAEASVRIRLPGAEEHWNEIPRVGTMDPDTSFQLVSKPVLRTRFGNASEKNVYAKIAILR